MMARPNSIKDKPVSLYWGEGKVALVTGGSRGIGLAIAAALVETGVSVFITGRDRKALKSASTQLGPKAIPVRCDVRDAKGVASLFREIKKKFGRLDFLINNAGVAHALLSVEAMPLDTWQE